MFRRTRPASPPAPGLSRPADFAALASDPTPGQRRLFSACTRQADNDRRRAWKRLEAVAGKPSNPWPADRVGAVLRATAARRLVAALLLLLGIPGAAAAFGLGYRLQASLALLLAIVALFALRAVSRAAMARLPLAEDEVRAFRARAAEQPASRTLLARWRKENRCFTQRDWLAVDAWVSACEEAQRWADVALPRPAGHRFGRGGRAH